MHVVVAGHHLPRHLAVMGLPGVPQSDRADVGNEHQDSDQQRHEDLPAVGTERAKALEQGVAPGSFTEQLLGDARAEHVTFPHAFMWAGLVPCLRRGGGPWYTARFEREPYFG
jgi:hypothetical protein